MPRDAALIDAFISKDTTRQRVRGAVEAAGFTIEHVISEGSTDRCWGLVLRMSSSLQELFGSNREVLLWASNYPTFQTRTIQKARKVLDTHRPRLSEEFVIIVSASRSAEREVAEATERLDTVFVGVAMHRFA